MPGYQPKNGNEIRIIYESGTEIIEGINIDHNA